jgi:hypothetical protein
MAITKVNAGDSVLATQQNTIVDGIEHATTGHKHTGVADGAPLLIAQGTAGARPAAGQIGRLYYSTDTEVIERDNGSTWDSWGFTHLTIGANDHHNESHSLTSHSSRAHSELTGVTSDLHHPQLHATQHQPGGGDAMAVDAAAATGSLRTLGTGALQALAGNTIIPSQSTQSALEAETNENTYAPPDLIKHSPGVAKAYCTAAGDGTLQSNSYNITSVVKINTGRYTVTFNVDFSNLNYSVSMMAENTTGLFGQISSVSLAVGSCEVRTYNSSGTLTDSDFHFIAFGDQ